MSARRGCVRRSVRWVIGRGGITLVSRVTGLSYPTIHKGIAELRSTAVPLAIGRIRRPGGGRKKVEVVDPAVLPILQEVVESSTAGSPMDVLRWTSKSKTNLAVALAERGHRLAPNTVGRLLRGSATVCKPTVKTRKAARRRNGRRRWPT